MKAYLKAVFGAMQKECLSVDSCENCRLNSTGEGCVFVYDLEYIDVDETVEKILSLPIEFEHLHAPKTKLETDVEEVLGSISELFRNKNEQYRTTDDDLANFTVGAMLRYGKADMPARFETLKDYVNKHIAKVYNGRLGDDRMDESIQDIAVYFILAMVMHKRMKEQENG